MDSTSGGLKFILPNRSRKTEVTGKKSGSWTYLHTKVKVLLCGFTKTVEIFTLLNHTILNSNLSLKNHVKVFTELVLSTNDFLENGSLKKNVL